MLPIFLLTAVICAAVCYHLGEPKGYNGFVCGLAGFVGTIQVVLIIWLLPDISQESYRAGKVSRHEDEISELKRRVAELEASQKEAE